MKVTLLIIVCLCFSVALFAQPRFGVKASLGYTSLFQKVDGINVGDHKFGYDVGGMVELPLSHRFKLQPELLLANRGGKVYMDEIDRSHYTRLDYYSLLLPIQIKYLIVDKDATMFVTGGPYLACNLFGNIKNEFGKRDMTFGRTNEYDIHRFDFGISAGIGVEYKQCIFAVTMYGGLLDRLSDSKNNIPSAYQSSVQFSLGYFINK
ncbi:MAG: porin family protein [Tannerellaceae bacterium]